ncbi:hypothetical protein QZH41_015311 [Actinostola sp. cb2023]|nr:hypothetical protein QZH41_015311 [Actinostola sp. cb2023]
MAALGFNNTTSNPVTVLVEVDKAQFALCTLQPGKIPQQTLDIAFTEGEEITFSTEGNNEVHLTDVIVTTSELLEIKFIYLSTHGYHNFTTYGYHNFTTHGYHNFTTHGYHNFTTHGYHNFTTHGYHNFTTHGYHNFTTHGTIISPPWIP